LPNTHGLALWADGGLIGSKPYAGSGAYTNRMSDYCRTCRYKPAEKFGPDACPFNFLYWNFLVENEEQLKDNPRLEMAYRTLGRMDDGWRARIRAQAKRFFRRHGMEAREGEA
jgi:deoxyribodipyrimidine photolyase-related protein